MLSTSVAYTGALKVQIGYNGAKNHPYFVCYMQLICVNRQNNTLSIKADVRINTIKSLKSHTSDTTVQI